MCGCASSTDYERPVEVFKFVPQESFSDRICEQIVDVPVPQVDELEALQFQVSAISHEMHGKCSDGNSSSEEFLTKTHELDMQLGECSKTINVLRDQKSGIFGHVPCHREEQAHGRDCRSRV